MKSQCFSVCDPPRQDEWTNIIFHEVVVDLDASVVEITKQTSKACNRWLSFAAGRGAVAGTSKDVAGERILLQYILHRLPSVKLWRKST